MVHFIDRAVAFVWLVPVIRLRQPSALECPYPPDTELLAFDYG